MNLPSDHHGLLIASQAAENSDDPNTQVGVLIMTGGDVGCAAVVGCNRTSGLKPNTGSWRERPQKYDWIQHAEADAIAQAARHGIPLDGATAFIWSSRPLFCCVPCANALVSAGVRRVVFSGQAEFEGADADGYGFPRAREIFELNGVRWGLAREGSSDYFPGLHT